MWELAHFFIIAEYSVIIFNAVKSKDLSLFRISENFLRYYVVKKMDRLMT